MAGNPEKNLIMPVSPMFASIMTGPASHLVKKLCRVKNISGHNDSEIQIVEEDRWGYGPINTNLKITTIKIGTIGMVVGVAEPKTVLRFLVSETADETENHIYHVSVLNLELLETQP